MIDRRDIDPRRQPDDRRSVDRRVTQRHALNGQIRFLRAGSSVDEILHGELLDVSASGIRILFDDHLKPSDAILVEVRSADNYCFNLSAVVVWVDPDDESGQKVGCDLRVDLTPKQMRLLKELSIGEPST